MVLVQTFIGASTNVGRQRIAYGWLAKSVSFIPISTQTELSKAEIYLHEKGFIYLA